MKRNFFPILLLSLTLIPAVARAQDVAGSAPAMSPVEYQKALGISLMNKFAERSDVLTMESGLQLQTVRVGTGARPRAKDAVVVNFKGFTAGGKLFSEGQAVEFPLYQLIEGFREGLQLMSEGGRSVIVIPCELGYGDEGAAPDVPGGATLLFDVELLQVIPGGGRQ